MSEHGEQTRLLEQLLKGAESGSVACGSFLANLDPLNRSQLYTDLLFARLERKMRLVEQLFQDSDGCWNQTFYLLYFRTLGDRQNQEAYLELAHRVPYRILLRERTTPHGIEAMLFGASGLLDHYQESPFIQTLRAEFAHYTAKYGLEAMSPKRWTLREVRPANHPILRLAQAAALFRQDEFLMRRTLACRTERDVRQIFCSEATPYWCSTPLPGTTHEERPRRLGAFKANIIGINLVAVLQFAYGVLTGSDSQRDHALSLLERLPAEDNRYMRIWAASGIRPHDAFESQALLQLITELCLAQGCSQCPVARRILHAR